MNVLTVEPDLGGRRGANIVLDLNDVGAHRTFCDLASISSASAWARCVAAMMSD